MKRNPVKRLRVLQEAAKPIKIWSKTNEVRNSPRRRGCRLDRRARHGSGPRPRGGFQRPLYRDRRRSEENTSELQSLMRISYAVFCMKKKKDKIKKIQTL